MQSLLYTLPCGRPSLPSLHAPLVASQHSDIVIIDLSGH